MKRQILLSLAATLIALPAFARDFTYTYEGQTLTYTVLDENAKTCEIGLNPTVSGNVVVPMHPVDGTTTYTVTAVGARAFYDNSYNKLTSIVLPNSVKTIGNEAFYMSRVKTIDFGNSVESIGTFAFQVSGLTSLKLPDSVNSIGDYAFDCCVDLASIDLGNSVKSLGKCAFRDGVILTSVKIPKSVISVGEGVFSACVGLKEIDVDIENEHFVSIDGVLYDKECTTLIQYPAGKTVKREYGVNNPIYTEFEIPQGVTNIGKNAFYRCIGLISVIMPKSIESIGDYVFGDCTNLKSVTVRAIQPPLFNGSPGFSNKNATLYVPEEAMESYKSAEYWSSFTSMIGFKNFVNIEIEGIHYIANHTDNTAVVTFAEQNSLNNYKEIQSVVIPEMVEYDGECYTVTEIGEGAFAHCSDLTSIEIPTSVTTIGNQAFYCCSNLSMIQIPNSVTIIGEQAFSECNKLTSVYIPNSVSEIGNNAFSYCKNLSSVEIPDTITVIGYWAFAFCSNLTSITVCATTPPTLYSFTFSGISSDATLYVPEESIDAYKNAENWRNFTNIVAIKKDFLENIDGLRYNFNPSYHTATVTYIEQNSLQNYEGLQSVVIPEMLTVNGESYTVTGIGDEAFNNCWGLKSVVLPSTLQSIGKLAFGYCTSLRSVVIPDEVTVIDDEAFTGCSALASVTIGNSVETIGDYAFFGCTGLATINVPESVKSIGENAFMGIHWINEVHANANVPADAPVSAFSTNAYRNATLVVPDGALSTYKSHPTWSNFLAIREEGNTTTDIVVVDGAIVVRGADSVKVYAPSGAQVYSGKSGRIELPSGIYLVVTDSVTRKIRL